MKNLARFLVIIFGVTFLVVFTLGASFIWDAFLKTPGSNAQEVIFSVAEGENVKGISFSLQQAELIPSRLGFELYVKLIRADHAFQPGDFTLKTGSNYSKLVSQLTAQSPDEVTITFPEGLNIEQMVERIDKAFGSGYGNQWRDSLNKTKWSDTYSFIPEWFEATLSTEALEGYLFPDTYRVFRSGFPDSLTYKLLTNFGEKFSPELRAEVLRQNKTMEEVVILASIVEKEVITDADRVKVADLFWRRLDAGMALQADSTVHYVVGNDDKNVYTSDLDRSVDSPYNTYKYPGLPPGPICNPSLSAIKAVIYPEANNAWYFLTDAEGSVHYAKTNDEQNENKALYLK